MFYGTLQTAKKTKTWHQSRHFQRNAKQSSSEYSDHLKLGPPTYFVQTVRGHHMTSAPREFDTQFTANKQ